jgi:hypothetical protein
MTVLQFIASLVGSLAWPTVVLVVVVLLRKEIRERLTFINRLKYGQLEVDFRAEVLQIEAETDIAPVEAPTEAPVLPRAAPNSVDGYLAQAEQLRAESPVSAVLLAWLALMAEVRVAARALPDSDTWFDQTTGQDMVARLVAHGALSQKGADGIDRLRRLRDLAVQTRGTGVNLVPEGASYYMDLVRGFIAELRSPRERPPVQDRP